MTTENSFQSKLYYQILFNRYKLRQIAMIGINKDKTKPRFDELCCDVSRLLSIMVRGISLIPSFKIVTITIFFSDLNGVYLVLLFFVFSRIRKYPHVSDVPNAISFEIGIIV